jgi:type VI protein secretion system component VasK
MKRDTGWFLQALPWLLAIAGWAAAVAAMWSLNAAERLHADAEERARKANEQVAEIFKTSRQLDDEQAAHIALLDDELKRLRDRLRRYEPNP